uniref:Uncharacterized protein n=1 Tax=Nelumbo nucifera TaxID=4432 RepID=A0A822YD53_NELNU|nr:TPA_asm: hypothetical protein HUJ06_030697 [Nelumbo nucifera]
MKEVEEKKALLTECEAIFSQELKEAGARAIHAYKTSSEFENFVNEATTSAFRKGFKAAGEDLDSEDDGDDYVDLEAREKSGNSDVAADEVMETDELAAASTSMEVDPTKDTELI